jgi:very-short-patch-repair endonuclease
VNIYLAGKIAKHDWRHGVVAGLRSASSEVANDRAWPNRLPRAIFGAHDYVGPFFIGCDHGCSHGESTHGNRDACGSLSLDRGEGHTRNDLSDTVRRLCFERIRAADMFFAWLGGDDAATAFGTFVEIGYAAAVREERRASLSRRGPLQIVIASDRDLPGMWFATGLSSHGVVVANTAADALAIALGEDAAILARCESPIETKLGERMIERLDCTTLVAQHEVAVDGKRYRLDFAFVPERLAIECDGHDFHERTKEQARHDRSRDRALQLAGWTVLRFTGSEIHRDVDACVGQVLRGLTHARRALATGSFG